MKLYLAVTADKYELPLFVTDRANELAEKFNTTKTNVMSSISHGNSGKTKGRKFIRIEVED